MHLNVKLKEIPHLDVITTHWWVIGIFHLSSVSSHFTRKLVSFRRNFSLQTNADVSSLAGLDLIGRVFHGQLACASRSMQHEISLTLDWIEKSINVHSSTSFKMLVLWPDNVRRYEHVSLILSAMSGLRNAIVVVMLRALYCTFHRSNDEHYRQVSIGRRGQEKEERKTFFSISGILKFFEN